MKNRTLKVISAIIFVAAGAAFLFFFAKPVLLRAYVQSGIGGSNNQPVFFTAVSDEVVNPAINKEFLKTLKCWESQGMKVCGPENFIMIKEEITKVYHKKYRPKIGDSTMYLLCESPGFYIGLFPQLKSSGITTDYDFIERMMNAKISEINTTSDAFFVIIKSILTANMGDQTNLKEIKFEMGDRKGFITYNLEPSGNHFDCSFFDKDNNYFKIYIRDLRKRLGLPEVFSIVSTAEKT